MITDDPILGVSIRNTKRHIRKKWKATAVGEQGPQLPVSVDYAIVKDPEDYIHPRRSRTEKCDCGYPRVPCPIFQKGCTRNYCFLEDE